MRSCTVWSGKLLGNAYSIYHHSLYEDLHFILGLESAYLDMHLTYIFLVCIWTDFVDVLEVGVLVCCVWCYIHGLGFC